MAITTQSYDANGTQTQFTIPFEYIDKADIDVYIDGVFQLQQNTTSTADPTHPQVISGAIPQGTPLINYTFSNDTTIEFNTAPTSGAYIFIERTTDETSVVTFAPGSTIRAAELNLALEQIRFIAQEGTNTAQLGAIPSKENDESIDAQGKRIENVADADSDDDAVNRGQLAGVITQDLLEGEAIDLTASVGGTNSGDQVTISVEDSSKTNKGAVSINEGEGINVTYTSGNAVISGEDSSKTNKGVVSINEGHAIGVTYTSGDAVIDADKSTASQQGVIQLSSTTPITITRPVDGEVELSIPDGTIDVAKIKADDVRTLAEQEATPNVAGSDDEIGTTAANDKRYDTIYQTGAPTETNWPVGKLWYDHVNDQTLSVWSGTNWLGISSGGTFITQPTVIWVDQANGDDANDGHRIIDSMKTIKAAVESADDGDIVLVAPGVYRESCPIDVTVNNLSIVGQSLRSCFVHPTPATEENTMFRVNSGTLLSNFSFAGMKASGTRGGNSIDTDSTYGLPTEQGWVIEFYPNAVIYKSPYIQNCTNFADSAIDNHTEDEFVNDNDVTGYFDPNNVQQGGFGGDLTSEPTGGGILIDGSAVSSTSPLRSMVVDAFTQITLDGPGLLCCNNGYGQLVSFFGTFCHYHAKALNGGQLNLSNCTTDYGRYGLIADGKSTTANFTASVTAAASAGDTTFTIGAPTAGADWYGSATRPQDNMSVTIGANTYPVSSAVANGSGWDVTIENPDPNANATNLGLTAALSIGDTASFFNRSYISTGGHTFEYVGAGTDYTAAPENGGVPIEANQVKNLNGGKVFQSSTDHNGKFKIGDTFTVNQRTGEVDISLDAYRPEIINDLSPQLGANLDVNNFNIQNDVSSGNLGVRLNSIAYPTSDGNSDDIMVTDGSGQLRFEPINNLTGTGIQDVVDDTTPQLGGSLDVNGEKIVSVSNGDIVIDPDGTGAVKIGDTSGGALSEYIAITDGKIEHNGPADLEIEAGVGGINVKSYITSDLNTDIAIYPRGTGNVDFDVAGTGGTRLVGVDDPVNAQDVATKNYVDTNFVDQTSSTGSANLPVGTTAERDASPAAGMIRYNSETGEFEGYTTAWGEIASGDADTLDGLDSTQFLRSDADDSTTGTLTAPIFNVTDKVVLPNQEKSDLANDGELSFDSSQGLIVYRTAQGVSGTAVTVLDGANVAAGAHINISNLGSGATNTDQITFSVDDGAGSGLNADQVDGLHASSFLRADASDTATGNITFNGIVNIRNAIDLADNDVLRFGSGDDCEMFTNGTHMYMDLNSGINNFIIRDGTTTRFTFNDNGTLTATAFNNSGIREGYKSSTAGQTGTFAFCTLQNNTADRAANYTTSGSNLRYSNANGNGSGTPGGSWRLMGRLAGNSSNAHPQETSLFLRYA